MKIRSYSAQSMQIDLMSKLHLQKIFMAAITSISYKGKRALIRVDFNVPLTPEKEVADDTRIRATLPTIRHVLSQGGSVVLMSHLGRPKGGVDLAYSLLPVVSRLSQLLDIEVKYTDSCVDEPAFALSENLKPGEVLLLENLRFYPQETDGDTEFAKALSRHGDIYINDAFGTAHRAHSSTAIIAQFFDAKSRCFGKLMGSEVESLEKAVQNGERPIAAIIGGAKVSSKIDVLKNLMSKVDIIIIGGGMAYTFVKAQGGNVGSSLVEDDRLDLAAELIKQAENMDVKLVLPVDSVNSKEFGDLIPSSITDIYSIPDGEMGLDIGPRSIANLSEVLKKAKTIIWNGPMGVFEFDNYKKGTQEIGNAIVEATEKGAFSLVGGGDSVAAVRKFGIADKVSYVSTGGGAMLEYMEGKSLPGITAMRE